MKASVIPLGQYNNEIEQFIYEICYRPIWEAVSAYIYIYQNPSILDLTYARIKYPDSALLLDMMLEFPTNIQTEEDSLFFDAVISCTIELQADEYGSLKTSETTQWLKVSCEAIIEDSLKHFNVSLIQRYSKTALPTTNGVATSKNIIPIIHADELDEEATRFLSRYYADALKTPMPVPVKQIAEDILHLTVLEGRRITDDFSIFGEICFSKGQITTYDPFSNTEKEIDVQRGTILIDSDTYWRRNQGCVNNTFAHEIYHWHRHRLYAAVKHILRKEKLIACRCPANLQYPSENEEWTDAQRMEWQANKMAPRILMPIQTFSVKAQELYEKYDYKNASDKVVVLEAIIDELAAFYKVSKQSAKIRLIDIGHEEAASVYNFDNVPEPKFNIISHRDAFYEYVDNPEFRSILDSGLFVYCNSYFVINDPKYVHRSKNGRYSMTDYAWKNLAECTLQFTYRRINITKHGEIHPDIFHHENRTAYAKIPHCGPNQNVAVRERAAEMARHRAAFETECEEYNLVNKTFWQQIFTIMEAKHWNTTIFMEKTGLTAETYSRAKNGASSTPDVRTIVSICSGLDLSYDLSVQLLASADHILTGKREDRAYAYVLQHFRGMGLEEKNANLIDWGVTPLGSKQYK